MGKHVWPVRQDVVTEPDRAVAKAGINDAVVTGVVVKGLADRDAAGALTLTRSRQRLADMGQEIFPREQQNPEALAALQKAEIEKWWPIIKEAGIKVQ